MKNSQILDGYNGFLKRNNALVVNGIIQRNEGRRKKIELKKEIKDMFPMLKERSSNLAYKMELYDDNELFLRRVKEIKEKIGDLPILLTFQREE